MSQASKTEKKEDGREREQGSTAMTRGREGRAFSPFSLMRWLFDGQQDLAREDRGMNEMLFVPDVEVTQRGDSFIVKADLPGMSSDDVRVSVDDDAVVIEGERRSEHEEEDEGVWRCERSYGRFQRVIPIPDGADPETAEARFDNGVLEVSLRAPQRKREGRELDIKSGSSPQRSKGAH